MFVRCAGQAALVYAVRGGLPDPWKRPCPLERMAMALPRGLPCSDTERVAACRLSDNNRQVVPSDSLRSQGALLKA